MITRRIAETLVQILRILASRANVCCGASNTRVAVEGASTACSQARLYTLCHGSAAAIRGCGGAHRLILVCAALGEWSTHCVIDRIARGDHVLVCSARRTRCTDGISVRTAGSDLDCADWASGACAAYGVVCCCARRHLKLARCALPAEAADGVGGGGARRNSCVCRWANIACAAHSVGCERGRNNLILLARRAHCQVPANAIRGGCRGSALEGKRRARGCDPHAHSI